MSKRVPVCHVAPYSQEFKKKTFRRRRLVPERPPVERVIGVAKRIPRRLDPPAFFKDVEYYLWELDELIYDLLPPTRPNSPM